MTVENIDRSKMTFEQAEGVHPLPRQLKLREVSPQLRAVLWDFVYSLLSGSSRDGNIVGRWAYILRDMHVQRFHRMADEFRPNAQRVFPDVKQVFAGGSYLEIFGFLEWALRHPHCPHDFAYQLDKRLRQCQAAYCVVNQDTISPISSEEERATIERAFANLASTEFNGARQHLKLAAQQATAGEWSACIRESINAVESTVRCIDPKAQDLRPALATLERQGTVHGSLKEGFLKLYGYASDEKGLRHSLAFDGVAKVDETDGLFMLGACASFVSYLINKGRAAGLIKE
ncbi:hypothetical protein HQ945_21745 [Phyllobacterium sp. BT25]|uniref:HEPN AbiJ-N-terminal domain-containing protein n=1 Tax=Phyllobacterium pellucidum TaxID=2740464 RepID=A0A849VZQ6_9HYPH|nr:hypothetical protein [Phyllobacterium pellucidum]NTS33887.1 hypothetical protein [Phyllobacterium pellucidum]